MNLHDFYVVSLKDTVKKPMKRALKDLGKDPMTSIRSVVSYGGYFPKVWHEATVAYFEANEKEKAFAYAAELREKYFSDKGWVVSTKYVAVD